jgi:hypothetical protein
LPLPEAPDDKEPNAGKDRRRDNPGKEIAQEGTLNHTAKRDITRVELLDQIRIFNPDGRKQLRLFGPFFRFQLPGHSLLSDRNFSHFASRQECPELAVRKLFELLRGDDEIVHEHDGNNRKNDIPDRKGDFFIHWHSDYLYTSGCPKPSPHYS